MALILPSGADVEIVAVLEDGSEHPIMASEATVTIKMSEVVRASVLVQGVELDLDGVTISKAPKAAP